MDNQTNSPSPLLLKAPKRKIIFLILTGVLLVGIAGALLYLHLEYGILYSKNRRQEISELYERNAQINLERTIPADFPAAEKEARKALKYNKNNVDAHILLARSLVAQERPEEARDVYLKGLKIEPDNFKMNFYLGNIYRDLDQFNTAEGYYKKALAIEPHNIECWINYALSYGLNQNDWAGAARVYEEAIKANPDNQQLKNLLDWATKNAGMEQ